MENDKRLQCDKCRQEFESKNELQDHARACTGASQKEGEGAKTRQAGSGQIREGTWTPPSEQKV